jgi:hypothetical protein
MAGYEMAVLEEGPLNLGRPPTASDLVGMAKLGLGMGKAGRISAINAIGSRLRIPRGGWPSAQARLFEKGDIRLVGVLALVAHPTAASHVASNLARASRFSDTNILLTLVTAAREHASSLTATTAVMIDSWREGGLDYLWDTKDKLGLPKSITGTWKRVEPFVSGENNREVHPAYIPARDQTVVYGAQISSSFQRNFKRRLADDLGSEASMTLTRASRVARLIWKAYSFLAPGGRPFDGKQGLNSQIGQGFGSLSALGYVEHSSRSTDPKASVNLNLILTDPALNDSVWVKSAKVRVCETLFLERLLTTVRELRVVS